MAHEARKHTFTAAARKQGTEVTLVLSGYIWDDNANASAAVAEKLLMMEEGDTLKVVLRNLYGGDTNEGMTLYHDFKALKPRMVVDGVVASMGTIIMLAGETVECSEHSKGMTHRATGSAFGDYEDMRARADANEAINKQMAEIYAERTGMTPEEAAATFMAKGKDNWFTAAKMKELGLVQEITKGSLLRTVAMKELRKVKEPEAILDAFAACLQEDEVQTEPETNEVPMNKELLKKLGLAENATQADIDAALDARLAKAEADAASLDALRKAEKQRMTDELTTLLDGMVKNNAMMQATRDSLLEKAKNGDVAMVLGTVREMGSSLVPHKSVTGALSQRDEAAYKVAADRASWNYNDWAQKDPSGLEKLRDSDRAAFDRLVKERPRLR